MKSCECCNKCPSCLCHKDHLREAATELLDLSKCYLEMYRKYALQDMSLHEFRSENPEIYDDVVSELNRIKSIISKAEGRGE